MISSSPQSPSSAMALPVFRLEAGRTALLTLQGDSVLYMGVHYFGRSVPCLGVECPGCDRAPSRCRGFLLALLRVGERERPVVVEASAPQWSRLEGLRQMEGLAFEPGLVVEASRKKRNSPLRLEPVSGGGRIEEQFRSRWRLLSALSVLFSLPSPRAGMTCEEWATASRPAAVAQVLAAIGRVG